MVLEDQRQTPATEQAVERPSALPEKAVESERLSLEQAIGLEVDRFKAESGRISERMVDVDRNFALNESVQTNESALELGRAITVDFANVARDIQEEAENYALNVIRETKEEKQGRREMLATLVEISPDTERYVEDIRNLIGEWRQLLDAYHVIQADGIQKLPESLREGNETLQESANRVRTELFFMPRKFADKLGFRSRLGGTIFRDMYRGNNKEAKKEWGDPMVLPETVEAALMASDHEIVDSLSEITAIIDKEGLYDTWEHYPGQENWHKFIDAVQSIPFHDSASLARWIRRPAIRVGHSVFVHTSATRAIEPILESGDLKSLNLIPRVDTAADVSGVRREDPAIYFCQNRLTPYYGRTKGEPDTRDDKVFFVTRGDQLMSEGLKFNEESLFCYQPFSAEHSPDGVPIVGTSEGTSIPTKRFMACVSEANTNEANTMQASGELAGVFRFDFRNQRATRRPGTLLESGFTPLSMRTIMANANNTFGEVRSDMCVSLATKSNIGSGAAREYLGFIPLKAPLDAEVATADVSRQSVPMRDVQYTNQEGVTQQMPEYAQPRMKEEKPIPVKPYRASVM